MLHCLPTDYHSDSIQAVETEQNNSNATFMDHLSGSFETNRIVNNTLAFCTANLSDNSLILLSECRGVGEGDVAG